MKKTSTVRKHPRKTKTGRTNVKRHNRRFQPSQKRKTKMLDPRMTGSFESLANKGTREYGMTLDLDKGKNTRIIEQTENIVRGQTGQENTEGDFQGRATVKVPEGTDVKIHTHPKHNNARDKYNRPSGGDIYNLLFRSLNDGDLDEAYIIGPDKSWYRYYLDIKHDSTKSRLHSEQEENRLWNKILKYDQKKFDREVETKYSSIYRTEQNIAHLDSNDRKKYLRLSVKIAELERTSKYKNGKRVRSRELRALDRESFDLFLSKKTQKRKQKIHSKGDTKLEINKIAHRRAFSMWTAYLHDEWKVRVERAEKNKDGSISMTYIPDK